ncbi:unnamed protein product [Rhizophagus irregularis]|nr:unnamed protein product [Rhizophagus irregularis]
MDENNENDQLIQKFEKKLKIQQESQDTKVEIPYQNPFNANVKKFSLINPMYDLVVSQMNVIRTCFFVHSHTAFVEEDGKNLSEEIKQIPQQLSDILVESTCELDTRKVSTLKNNLVVFMNISGSKAIPDWVNE